MAAVIWAFGPQSLGALEIGLLYAFVSYIARVADPLISDHHAVLAAAAGDDRRGARQHAARTGGRIG